jgi:anti-sigma factor ChrR (cupin superfamily)
VPAARIVLRDLFGANQDLGRLAWQPFRPGIEIVRLYGEGSGGPAAALLRYAPGASLSAHAHVDYEHVVVLAGSQRDEHDARAYAAGTCVINPPGSAHRVASEEGCVVLAVWSAPVAFEP